jgi:hypothetical protein
MLDRERQTHGSSNFLPSSTIDIGDAFEQPGERGCPSGMTGPLGGMAAVLQGAPVHTIDLNIVHSLSESTRAGANRARRGLSGRPTPNRAVWRALVEEFRTATGQIPTADRCPPIALCTVTLLH